MSYLVTGASRGIGLELVKQLLELPASQATKVFALSRANEPPAALKALLDKCPDRAVHIAASVDDTESVQRAAVNVETNLGGQGLDVLVNNAGINGGFYPGRTKSVPPEAMAQVLNVNVIGVHRVTAAFLPLLEKGKQKKVINITSTLGSITYASFVKLTAVAAYNVSKAALNMLNAQYAIDHAEKGFTFLAVSPGYLKTDLGGQDADLEVEVGVADVKRIILEANPAQNGKFVNIDVAGMEEATGRYDGKEVPW